MIVDGLLDVQIRTLNSDGTPTSATSLVGIVKNSLGEEVHRFDFNNLTETAHGVYAHADFDVTDPQKYPGANLSIFWYTCDAGVSPENTFQYYDFYPNTPNRSKQVLLTWAPALGRLFGYQIERQRPSEDDYVIVGYATSPYYIDHSVYASDNEVFASRWRVRSMVWGSFDDDTPILSKDMDAIKVYQTEHDYCVLSGMVSDLIGRPSDITSIYFYVHESDAPMIKGSTLFMRRNELAVPLNSQGYFSVPLIQGLYVTVEIPDTGVAGKFLVPKQKHAQFNTLELTPLERYRGQ